MNEKREKRTSIKEKRNSKQIIKRQTNIIILIMLLNINRIIQPRQRSSDWI